MRHWLPILRPLRLPASSSCNTSATDTDKACATCSGVSSSGTVAAVAAGAAPGTKPGMDGAAAAPKPPCIIDCPMARPAASSAPMPAVPALPSASALPMLYLT
ncbi:hypothetical protein D9M69_666180 [compost metagenome]